MLTNFCGLKWNDSGCKLVLTQKMKNVRKVKHILKNISVGMELYVEFLSLI